MTINDGITRLCERLTNASNDRLRDFVTSCDFYAEYNRKFARIVRRDYVHGKEAGRSAHCFVKLDDGSIWKPAGWKGPAKNFPRGNVVDLPDRIPEFYGR